MRHDARDIGVHDEDASRFDAFQAGPDCGPLAASRIGDGLGSHLDCRACSILV
jgi:hypothetical protein